MTQHEEPEKGRSAIRLERDELEAKVERLLGAGERLLDTSQDSRAVAYWVEVVEETKAQSSREVRAEAVERCFGHLTPFNHEQDKIHNQIYQYAQQIREGNK